MRTEALFENLGLTVRPNGERDLLALGRQPVIDLFREANLLLFRGFDADADGFEAFSGQFCSDFMTYTGGGYVRQTINREGDGSIMSVNYYLGEKDERGEEQQSMFELPIHGEMYYMDNRPAVMFFCCVTPVVEGGETSLADGARVYQDLSDATRRLFEAKQLMYLRRYEDGEWQKRFETDSVSGIEAFCAGNGIRVRFDAEARRVTTEYTHPAVIESRWTRQKVFINNILPVVWQEESTRRGDSSVVRFEDESRIPATALNEVKEVVAKARRLVSWERGDLLMLDNSRVMHGRMTFTDPRRELYSRMGRQIDW